MLCCFCCCGHIFHLYWCVNGLVQDCRISSALVQECSISIANLQKIPQSCTKLLMCIILLFKLVPKSWCIYQTRCNCKWKIPVISITKLWCMMSTNQNDYSFHTLQNPYFMLCWNIFNAKDVCTTTYDSLHLIWFVYILFFQNINRLMCQMYS